MPSSKTRSGTAFAVIASAIVITAFASGAPSPLYPIYQELWEFSALTLTAIFAVYVGAMLITLLTMGSLSDQIGRRPVLITSMLLLGISMIVLATAGGVSALVLGRILQGLATGALLGTLSATVVDLQPSRRAGALVNTTAMVFGLGLGVAATAALVEFGPAPRHLVFVLLVSLLIIGIVATATLVPETSSRRGISSLGEALGIMAPRMSVHPEVRAAFAAGVPVLVATWALGGLNLSLGSSIARQVLEITNVAVVGLLLSTFFFVSAITALISSGRRPVALPASLALLMIGLGVQLAGTLQASAFGYVVGLFLTGTGFSTAYGGVVASLSHVPASARGQLFSVLYTVSYLAFSVPAVAGGLAVDAYGLRHATYGYIAFVMLMVFLAGTFHLARRRNRPAEIPDPSHLAAARE
ncbi:MFS transporter [Kineosporia babensis]|uniref:MFS transporter n=1 Tax=Kineosporia babensis TaxID=499548 RepID=A0A9X1SU01_9ACTN|nr:MFS transporter [Kineosporia babensis]